MAYVHEVKFFQKDSQLYVALFDNPTVLGEFWIKNVSANSLGIKKLPSDVELETKYSVEALGIQPFPASKPLFEFMDAAAKLSWARGSVLAMDKVSEYLN